MSPDAVPPWMVVRADGSVAEPEWPGEAPTRHCGAAGDLLVFQVHERVYVLAPSSAARIDWITTVDVRVDGGARVRRVGPGLAARDEAPIGPVRMWIAPDSSVVVLTDGPVEAAIDALRRVEDAARGASWPSP